VFERATAEAVDGPDVDDTAHTKALSAALAERGVTLATACDIARRFPAPHILTQLEVFDWLMARQDPKVSRNPPGFLVRAIQGGYAPPRDFVSRAECARRAQAANERKRRGEARQRQRQAQAAARETEQQTAIAGFWQALSYGEKTRMDGEALSKATALQRTLLRRGGSGAAACRTALLEGYALRRLGAAQAGGANAAAKAETGEFAQTGDRIRVLGKGT
jgi:hypothetical protein